MCTVCETDPRTGMSRRRLLAGFAAVAAAGAATRPALAMPPSACFSPAALAGTPAERLAHRPTAADAVIAPVPAEAGPPVAGPLAGVIRHVELPAGQKLIALTFDLCQTRGSVAGYDGAIVDYLRSETVPATFFAGGLWLATHRERAVQLAADPLFELGNHSWTHHDLHSATGSVVADEILRTEAALADTRAAARTVCERARLTGGPRLFRFPYGSCAPAPLAAVNALGSVVIQWSVVSGDPDGTSGATISHAVLAEAKPGSIVVMHANGRGTHTAEALRAIVPALRARGFTFATVAELLAAGRPVAAADCYLEREGDTARYDDPSLFKAEHPAKKVIQVRG